MLDFDSLLQACTPGGASVLTSVTELKPAAGSHASIAPAKFVERSKSVFAFETRFIDGEPVQVALIDSKQSSINRGENAVSQAIKDGHPILSRIPRISVKYGDELELTDFDLPHRFADGHIRAGKINGEPATSNETYRAVRNSTQANALAILNTAPSALFLGGWDSTRKSNQLKLRSAVVGEIIGVLADQERSGEEQISLRGGARVDPVAASVKLSAPEYRKLLDAQAEELSKGNLDKNDKSIKSAKKGDKISASPLGLGAIPPSLESLGGVSCRRIIRSWVLSFATLRQLRFDKSPEANVAGRALLAALALNTIARAEEELYIRANCDLVEAGKPVVSMDKRYGEVEQLPPLTVKETDQLLQEALDHAEKLGVAQWNGQVLTVEGDSSVYGGAADEAEE